jgi:glutaredoxin
MKKWLLVIFALTFIAPNLTSAQTIVPPPIEIYFFSSETCPHCKAEREFLDALKIKYPEINITEYEVVSHTENQKILKDFYDRYEVPTADQGWVPVTFTPTKYFRGFDENIGQEIENCLKECLGQEILSSKEIQLPFFGKVDVSKMSLPVVTVIFGALDGLNPCAFWVLIFLLTLLINTRSRKRMWFIAGTFLFISATFYFLLLSAWLNLFLVISYVNITRMLIGAFAVGVGVWQIKEFITYNPGVCRALGLKARLEGRLRQKAEKIVSSPFTWAIIGGVVFLAVGVNLIEFFCSAGLPAIYTRILSLSHLPAWNYYLYLLLYTFIFILDDLIVFSLAIVTLSKVNFTDKYNYWATLIGGLLIFILGLLLIFKPAWLIFT